MFLDMFKGRQVPARVTQLLAELQQETAHLAGLVKQLRRDLDELDESSARRFKRIAARNAAPGDQLSKDESATTEVSPGAGRTWRERLAARRANGNAEV